jgi:hypothetical protein
MKMSEADDQSVLMMSDSAQIPPKIAKPRAGINDGNTICIRERNLKTGGVAAELLEASITDWDGAASTVKFQLHTELYGRLCPTCDLQLIRRVCMDATSMRDRQKLRQLIGLKDAHG